MISFFKVFLKANLWRDLVSSLNEFQIFKLCGLKYLLLKRKILFVVSFTDSTTHWNIFRNISVEETIEKLVASGKQICVLGDFNIDLSKAQGPVSRKPRKVFGPVKPFLDHLYLKTKKCIPSKPLV